MGDDLSGKLCSSIITRRVTLNVTRPRIFKVGAAGDPISNAGWYKNRKAKRDEILTIRRVACSAKSDALLGLACAPMPEHQIGRTRPAGIPEHSDNHFLTDFTRAGMTDGHRKVELFLDNLRTYVLANRQEQQRCKEGPSHI